MALTTPPDRIGGESMDHQDRMRSRRTHHKSRLGCRNCKARRIKCDENKPTCSNCQHHAIACDFTTGPTSLSPATPDLEPQPRRYRFKPSRYQASLNPSNKTSTSSTGTQCDFPVRTEGLLSLADLQLFHHFVTSTYRTLSEDEHGHPLWQIHVPQWSMTFSSIRHLILALSALHRGYEQPELRGQLIEQADQHFTFGVTSVTSVLSQFELTPENAQPVYISAILICIIYFARGPRAGEFLLFSDTGQAEWLVLLRGVRLIVETQRQNIFKGVMLPNTNESQTQQHISTEWQEAWKEDHRYLLETQQLVRQRSADAAQGDMHASLVDALIQSFEDLYLKMSAGTDRTGLLQIVVGWLYRLPEEYISLLQQEEPCALIVLSYWTILVQYMRPVWFMRNWDHHVIDGILHSLQGDWKECVFWPVRRIQSVEPE